MNFVPQFQFPNIKSHIFKSKQRKKNASKQTNPPIFTRILIGFIRQVTDCVAV